MMKEWKEETRKTGFFICIAISFIAVLFYTCMTPVMSDDLTYIANPYQSIRDILKACYAEYMDVNARQVTHFIMRCILSVPKWIFNILNAFVFVIVLLLMYWNIDYRKKYDVSLFVVLNLLVWFFGVSLDQTVLWTGGSCNYLWGALIFLSFITFFRYLIKKQNQIRHEVLVTICIFVLGILSGWCNENSSGGCLLIILAFSILSYLQNRKIRPWMISGILGNVTGLAFLVLAPGNSNRIELVPEEHTGILAIVGRFLKINIVVHKYFLGMFILILFVFLLDYFRKESLGKFMNVGIFAVAGLATSYVLIFIPQPMDRAHFGAGLFITIACAQAIMLIPKDDVYLNTIKYGCMIAFTAVMYFSYIENGANLTRIYRETQEREAYILEQKENGNMDLVVPMIRPEFQTKFSFIYRNDVSEDPNSWGCVIYRDYYGLNSLRGIPREDWTEY